VPRPRQWRRLFVHPIASSILLIALILDGLWLSDPYGSVVGRAVFSHINGARIHARDGLAQAYVRLADQRVVIFDSWDEPSRLLSEEPDKTLLLTVKDFSVRSGFWSVTHIATGLRLESSFGAAFTPQQAATARRSLCSMLGERGWISTQDADRLQRQDVQETRWKAAGFLHDTLAAIVACAFVCSLRWIPESLQRFRARRLLSRGLCPSCRYSLAGLETGVCPECGTPIHPDRANLK
jgi:hypothetical protein